MKVKSLTVGVILISLFLQISIVEADIGDQVTSFFSWVWTKTRKQATKLIDKIDKIIEQRSASVKGNADGVTPPPLPPRSPITSSTTSTTTTPNRKTAGTYTTSMCGVTRYVNDELKQYLGRYARAAKAGDGDGEPILQAVSMRISGGRQAKINEAPWLVRIVIDDEEQCGGTLLNSRTILTAAHCTIKSGDPSKYHVTLGEHNLSKMDAGEKVVGVSKIIRHPHYDHEGSWAFDFALLITTTEIKLERPSSENLDDDSWRVRPVCMPVPGVTFPDGDLAGMGLTVAGWGYIDSSEKYAANVLRLAKVRAINHSVCKSRYRNSMKLTEDVMFCAGYDAGDVFVDTCRGDSGGGATALRNGRHTLVGVTSFGMTCDNKEKIPGVYARVSVVVSWIEANAVGQLFYPE